MACVDLTAARRELLLTHTALATVFAKYPLRGHTEGCSCCVSAADHAELQSGNLRRYAFKAMTTWGSEADFKHFLPVILTALTPYSSHRPGTVHGGSCDFSCFANKLAYAHWQHWPAEEQQAILDCLRAWWLMCLALLQQDFAEFLAGRLADGWDNSVEPAYQELTRSGLLSAAWLQETWHEAMQPAPNQPPAAYVQSPAFLLLVDWLFYFYYRNPTTPLNVSCGLAVRQYLEEGFFYFASRSPGLAHRLSDLLYCLEHAIPRSASDAD